MRQAPGDDRLHGGVPNALRVATRLPGNLLYTAVNDSKQINTVLFYAVELTFAQKDLYYFLKACIL